MINFLYFCKGNIMLQRYSGKIVHIDFGDCWEVAMKREKFPEKVPFRLTRMLVKAMEACGIEGNYRNTCELVMKVLRENKESLMAVLEAFVYDPLLNWRLLTISIENDIQTNFGKLSNNPLADKKDAYQSVLGGGVNINRIGNSLAKMGITNRKNIFEDKLDKLKHNDMKEPSPKRKEIGREKELQQHFADEAEEKPTALLNQKALTVVDRIKKKLVGKDFKENEALKVEEQVNKLIKQATSHENICQAYMGWCPFW
jgi:FKBP12-rapamycin complex-associated protein